MFVHQLLLPPQRVKNLRTEVDVSQPATETLATFEVVKFEFYYVRFCELLLKPCCQTSLLSCFVLCPVESPPECCGSGCLRLSWNFDHFHLLHVAVDRPLANIRLSC